MRTCILKTKISFTLNEAEKTTSYRSMERTHTVLQPPFTQNCCISIGDISLEGLKEKSIDMVFEATYLILKTIASLKDFLYLHTTKNNTNIPNV